MAATKESAVEVYNSRRLAAFAARVNEVITSLPYSVNFARAMISDWLGIEQARNIAEVERCLENCSAHEREYWTRKLEKVRYGESWQRGHPLCDLTWPDDDLDKAVRALAVREFCGFGDPEPPVHPKCGHYAPDLVECTPVNADLDGWLNALVRQLRSAGPTWNDGNVVARLSDEKSLLRGDSDKAGPVAAAPKNSETHLAPKTPRLSRRKQHILIAALELSAFSSDTRRTATEIAETAEGTARSNGFKKPLRELVKVGYLESAPSGRDGGYWLTKAGRDRASELAQP